MKLTGLLITIVFGAVFLGACTIPAEPLAPTETPMPLQPKPTLTPVPAPIPTPFSGKVDTTIAWESMNGSPGGSMTELIQNPYRHNELYTVTRQGDLYKSEDKGNSWRLMSGLEDISVNSIALFEDKLFVCGNGIYYLDGNENLFRILDSRWNEVIVSDEKLFVTRSDETPENVKIKYADLGFDDFVWKDISPTAIELGDLVVPPSDIGLLRHVEVPHIFALGNRILASITVSVEGNGELTNGHLYTSEDLGQTWNRVQLDVPSGVIVANIVQGSANPEHIFVLFRHPISHEVNYPISNLVKESYDGGRTWSHVTDCTIKSNGVTDIAVDGSVYYLINHYNDYILKLDGSDCEKIEMPRLEGFQELRLKMSRLFFDLDDPNIVYGGDLLGSLGIIKSEDHMKTWRKMDGDIVASSPTIVISHPSEPGTVFTAGNVIQETYCTRDGGGDMGTVLPNL